MKKLMFLLLVLTSQSAFAETYVCATSGEFGGDAWCDRLKDRSDVVFLKDIGDGGGIHSFLLEDPGGYTVEFFAWRDSQE